MVSLNNIDFSPFWKGESKVKALADLVSGVDLLLGSYMAIFLRFPHMEEGARELFWASLIKTLS